MKKRYAIVFAVMLASGCGTDESEQPVLDTETDTIEEHARDLPAKIENVQNTLVALKAAEGNEDIQQTGKSLEEHWDLAEAEIEEQYPEDYASIEESLYPLIAEAKKDSPDAAKLAPLIQESNEKLNVLLEKASKPKKKENEVELDLDQGNS